MDNDIEIVFNAFSGVVTNLLVNENGIDTLGIEKNNALVLAELDYLNIVINSIANDKICFIFSFEQNLIQKIFEEYTKELDLGMDYNLQEYLEHTGTDFTNIVLGHMLSFFKCAKRPVISVPYILSDEISLKTSVLFHKILVDTPYGSLCLYFAQDILNKYDIESYEYFVNKEMIA